MAGNALNPFQFEPRYTAEEVERRRAEGIQRNEPIVRPENDRSRILRRRLEGELSEHAVILSSNIVIKSCFLQILHT